MLRARGKLALGIAIAMMAVVASGADASSPRASFSCERVSSLTRVEREVCLRPPLAALDMKLAYAFASALERSRRPLYVDVQEAAWLHDVRDACHTDGCLESAYRERIAALRSEAEAWPSNGTVWSPGYGGEKRLIARLNAIAHSCFDDVARVDLGDGASSAVAFYCLHGNDNSGVAVFHAERGSFRQVLFGITNRIELLNERAYGLRALRVWGHASAWESGLVIATFDGRRYRPKACFDFLVRPDEGLPRATLDDCRYSGVEP